MTVKTKAEKEKLLEELDYLAKQMKYNAIKYFKPYEKQKEFYKFGATKRERLLMAGNQVGKTHAGAAEVTYHLTGLYPDWWKGRRWDRGVRCWVAGETSLATRDVQQKKLCGEPGVNEDFGAGLIPLELFVDKPSMSRGVTDAFDTIQVRHVSGDVSVLRFKSYEQGRKKFQGETLDFLWFDEEPDLDIYAEGLTRITATRGMVLMTFTPMLGQSHVVNRFTQEPSEDRVVVKMAMEDAKHLDDEKERERILAGYPEHQRDARSKGIPLLGSGAIFKVPEATVLEAIIDHIPAHWAKIWGVDFGIMHPFAAALLAWDRDNDVIHVLATIRISDGLPILHAAQMKQIGALVPVAWPQDGTQRDKGSGDALHGIYRAQGLKMLSDHATWPEGGNSTEAGIIEIQQREATGRIKYASHLSDLLEERRFYHRKDGQIVKLNDDILSAVRIGVMMKRHARPVALGGPIPKSKHQAVATDVDFDYFS